MNETSKVLSIIAYYLSEYDMNAVIRLGFSNRSEAMKQISAHMGRENQYLKLRRDEFDALPSSSSHRRGWANRPAIAEVENMASYLRQFSFEELSEIVLALIGGERHQLDGYQLTDKEYVDISSFSEEEVEAIINRTDPTARLKLGTSPKSFRVYNPNVITGLKRLYNGQCQICGCKPLEDYNAEICEAHHIEAFSKSENNNADNLIIICPNHHRLIHTLNPEFDRVNHKFIFKDGTDMKVTLNYHL